MNNQQDGINNTNANFSNQFIFDNITRATSYYQEILNYLLSGKVRADNLQLCNNQISNNLALKLTEKIINNPNNFIQMNFDYLTSLQKLISDSVNNFFNQDNKINIENKEIRKDRRFKDPAWRHNAYFDFIRQYYDLNSFWIKGLVEKLDLKAEEQKYIEFAIEQFINASCPSNFAFSNPEVIRESLNSGMENIAKGMENFLNDIKNTGQLLSISTNDTSYFELGKNLATTEGKIIYQNDLMQLICYKPKNTSYANPILIIPSWINKYYILDLSENNSLVKWLVDNNFQVFLISWVNPDENYRNKCFEDYLKQGIIDATNQIKKLGFNKINTVGYCVGGTLLATAICYMQKQSDNIINSATFFTTLIDFSNPGEIGSLINKATLEALKEEVNKTGYLNGKYLSNSFNLIRANDLIWSFFINNYLLGKKPNAFDVLYWNSDPTNLPARMYIYYLTNMYINNSLIKPNALKILDTTIDITKINIPSFSLAAKADHIALWQAVYDGYRVMGGDKTFCLTEAGHVVGVINPAHNTKYSYTVGNTNYKTAEEWIGNYKDSKQGSWWNEWKNWLIRYSGKQTKSINYDKLKFIEKAPGSYVRNNPVPNYSSIINLKAEDAKS